MRSAHSVENVMMHGISQSAEFLRENLGRQGLWEKLGSKLRKRRMSPILAMWVMETTRGKIPKLEKWNHLD